MRFWPVFALSAVLVASASVAAGAGTEQLNVAQIFAKEPLTGRLPSSITWAPDGSRFLYTLPGGTTESLATRLYDMRTHTSRVFFRAFADGRGSRPAPEFVWSPNGKQLAYLDRGALFTIDASTGMRRKLASDADDPQWSPDGTQIAFVHGNELARVSAAGGTVQRLSHDGTDDAQNASPDWAYSEELEMKHAYAWSPNGRAIVYLHIDDTAVSAFPILNSGPYINRVEKQRYPNAGEANPIATMRVVEIASGVTRTLYSTKPLDDYLAWVGFTGAGDPAAEIVNRAQNQRRIVTFSPAPRSVFSERSATWIDPTGAPLVIDRRRLAIVTRNGSSNVVRLIDTSAGTSVRAFSAIAINSLAAVDAAHGVLIVTAAGPTRRDVTAFSIPLSGGVAQPYDRSGGAHRYVFSPLGNAFVVRSSTFNVPPSVAVGQARTGMRTTIARSRSLARFAIGNAELRTIPSRFGSLDATIVLPPDFDPAKRYPVVTYVYGGPAAPTALDEWNGQLALFHRALAQRGVIVFSVDGPGSQVDGTSARKVLYRSLGDGALAGQLEGARYLQSLPYVDASRMGIWGWSYGGYLTAFALTHSPDTWQAGFAVAPVTDWRRYDSIYTERYMGKPQQNAAAYARASVTAAAARMHGHLMLAHGTSDDNVHVANTLSLATALTNSGRTYDLALYPGFTHGIRGIAQEHDLFGRMLRFWSTEFARAESATP